MNYLIIPKMFSGTNTTNPNEPRVNYMQIKKIYIFQISGRRKIRFC